jgi:hypothetical protein
MMSMGAAEGCCTEFSGGVGDIAILELPFVDAAMETLDRRGLLVGAYEGLRRSRSSLQRVAGWRQCDVRRAMKVV